MVFLKPLEKLEFSDIEKLKVNKVCESQILDYKSQLLDDNKLLKHVSAFANTQGGFLIFGVEETGKGGYPKDIVGVEKNQLDKERIEQIILSNIQPRLNVKINVIEHKTPSKGILIIEIPNSYLKPHMNGRDNKFYRRHNFEASPMTEMEVNDTYKRRFRGYRQVEEYISKIMKYDFLDGVKAETFSINGKIIIVPTTLERMIDTSNVDDFRWLGKLNFEPKYPSVFKLLWSENSVPSQNGLKCQRITTEGNVLDGLEIHRNGLVHAISYFGAIKEEKTFFLALDFCVTILHSLDFASRLYNRYNYFGDVRVVYNLRGVKDSLLRRQNRQFGVYDDFYCHVDNINIVRELPLSFVKSKREYIASGIMDEIFNCYGIWKCMFFNADRNFIALDKKK